MSGAPAAVRLRNLFDELVDATAERRAAILQELSGEPALAREVAALLEQDERLRQAQDSKIASTVANPYDTLLAAHYLGRHVDAFRLTRLIGVGGMGAVFLGERSEGGFAQVAAIKILRPDALNETTRIRFQLECQALALLEHPHIARLYAAGTLDDTSPYLVMEYVEGQPITDYCEARALGVRERLALFEQVCATVSEAHRRLIVHRDLKPGNIFVSAAGAVKLLDFGIAKSLATHIGSLATHETVTEQRFFSPLHAAPEQFRGEPVTVGCDVYGLGVLLYELLCARLPFETAGATPGAIEQMILHTAPLPPSEIARAGSPPAGAQPPSPAIAALARADASDLDSIALRCLRKSVRDRYGSVDELIADVRNYLDGRPVAARRGNAAYRARLFARRHRRSLAVGALVGVAALVAGLAMRNQFIQTDEQRTRADQMTTLILSAVKSADPTQKKEKDLSAREIFERIAGQLAHTPDIAPASRARLLAAIAEIDLNLGLAQQAVETLDKVDTALLEPTMQDQVARERVQTLTDLAKFDDARAALGARSMARADPTARARWALLEASLDYQQGKLEQGRDILLALHDVPLDTELSDAVRAQLARFYSMLGDLAGAEREYQNLLTEQRQRMDSNDPALVPTLIGISQVQTEEEKYDAATAASEQALGIAEKLYGKQSLRYISALSARQKVAMARNGTREGQQIETEILRLLELVLGPQNPSVARSHFNLGSLNGELGDRAGADLHFQKAIEIGERVWLPEDLNRVIFRVAYACYLIRQGDYKQAKLVIDPALVNVDEHPKLKEFDVYPLALFIARLGEYDADRTPAKRLAAEQAYREAHDKAEGRSTKHAVGTLEGVVAKVSSASSAIAKHR